MNYLFKEINRCSFCGAEKSELKVIGKRLNRPQGFRPHKKAGISISVIKCRRCGLIFSNPLPIPEKISDHYGIPAEEYWKPEYFNVPDGFMDGFIQLMKKKYAVSQKAKILDIGAGIGKAMIAFQRHGFDIYGIEPSKPFYDKAIDKMGISQDKLSFTTVEDAVFSPNSFDVILLTAVFEHLYFPDQVLLKLLNWLKPNGLIFIEVPSANWLISKIFNAAYWVRGLDYVTHLSPMHSPFHLYEFTKNVFEYHAQKKRI